MKPKLVAWDHFIRLDDGASIAITGVRSTLRPTDATHGGGGQRRGAVWPEIEARQKGHFF